MARRIPKKILVVRNDKLGDFMLSFPAFALLKASLPDSRVYALVPEYTKDMADACQWIDETLIDKWQNSDISSTFSLLKLLRQYHFDAVITLYSTTRVGLSASLAGIPYRLAPATKLAQIFYNHRLSQRRSRSEKPEYAYNSDLVLQFCHDQYLKPATPPTPPFLQFDNKEVSESREKFYRKHKIPPSHKLIFVHPGSGGSARNLSIEQYAELSAQLQSRTGHTIVISTGPGEFEYAQKLSSLLSKTDHVIYESRLGLTQFAQHIQFSDMFIGGSTGPVHVAGALNRPTVAFYPRRRSATSLRWQTLNSEENRLSFSPPQHAAEEDMSEINIEAVAKAISKKFLSS